MAKFDVDLVENEGAGVMYGPEKMGVLKRTVDFSMAANLLAQNKIMSLFKIPAKVLVTKVIMNVLTADADVTTVNMGVYTEAANGDITEVDLDGFGVNLDPHLVGLVANDVDAVYNSAGTGGRGYVNMSAESIITLQNVDAQSLDSAVIEFYAVCEDLR